MQALRDRRVAGSCTYPLVAHPFSMKGSVT
jgi:hypothetical protein